MAALDELGRIGVLYFLVGRSEVGGTLSRSDGQCEVHNNDHIFLSSTPLSSGIMVLTFFAHNKLPAVS